MVVMWKREIEGRSTDILRASYLMVVKFRKGEDDECKYDGKFLL